MVDYNSLSDAYKSIYEAAKAKKDFDGDGEIESGAKEHAGAVHNAIQKKRGLKPDGKDTTGIKEEEIVDEDDLLDENRRMARDPEGRNSGHSKQPDPSKDGFTGIGNMSIDQIRKMSARIDKEKTKKEEVEYVDEKTAMAKRGYDEAPIRRKIAKSTGGGKSADRATDLENRSTYGDAKKAKQRQDYARKQRGDFRKTTSSSPGLHGYAHKSDDPKVQEKQAARGAQRGALTPKEKKELNREEFDAIVTSLIDQGFDLSQYTIDEMVEMCYDAMDQIEMEESCGKSHGSDTKNKKPSKKNYRESFNLPNARVAFSKPEKVVESGPSAEQIAEAAPAIVAAAGRLAASQAVKGAAKKAGTKLATAGVEAIVDKIGDRIAGKRDEEA